MDPRIALSVAVLLLVIGMAGFLMRRNLLVVFMSVELMLNAGALCLVTFARVLGDADGHVMFFFVVALAAAESAVGLALVIATYRVKHRLDSDGLTELRG